MEKAEIMVENQNDETDEDPQADQEIVVTNFAK